MRDLGFRIQIIPLQIYKETIDPFLNKIIHISTVCPIKPQTREAQVDHVTHVKAFFEQKRPIYTYASAAKFIISSKGLIEVSRNNLRKIMRFGYRCQIIP